MTPTQFRRIVLGWKASSKAATRAISTCVPLLETAPTGLELLSIGAGSGLLYLLRW